MKLLDEHNRAEEQTAAATIASRTAILVRLAASITLVVVVFGWFIMRVSRRRSKSVPISTATDEEAGSLPEIQRAA